MISNKLLEQAYKQLGYRGKYRYKKEKQKKEKAPAVLSLAEQAMNDYINRQPIHGGCLSRLYLSSDYTSGCRPITRGRVYNAAKEISK